MEKVSLSRIVGDRTFHLSFPEEPGERLLGSMREVGLLQPLLVLDGEKPRIVSGFRRFAAATALGWRDIAVTKISVSDAGALRLAVHANLDRGYNMVEKAICLVRMEDAGFSPEETAGTMALLGIETAEKTFATLRSLASAGDEVKEFVVAKGLSMKSLDLLLRFNPAERAGLAGLFSRLRATESLAREVLELILLLRVRGREPPWEAIFAVSSVQDARGILKREAHPVLSGLEESLAALRRDARLPPSVDVKVDPFFEKEYIDIALRVRSEPDLRDLLGKLERLLEGGIIGRILELTQSKLR